MDGKDIIMPKVAQQLVLDDRCNTVKTEVTLMTGDNDEAI